MNLSGNAVRDFMNFYKVKENELIVEQNETMQDETIIVDQLPKAGIQIRLQRK